MLAIWQSGLGKLLVGIFFVQKPIKFQIIMARVSGRRSDKRYWLQSTVNAINYGTTCRGYLHQGRNNDLEPISCLRTNYCPPPPPTTKHTHTHTPTFSINSKWTSNDMIITCEVSNMLRACQFLSVLLRIKSLYIRILFRIITRFIWVIFLK